MECDRGDSFLFDFETNEIPFGSENQKENCHHDHIPLNLKGNESIGFSVRSEKRQTKQKKHRLSERIAYLYTMGGPIVGPP